MKKLIISSLPIFYDHLRTLISRLHALPSLSHGQMPLKNNVLLPQSVLKRVLNFEFETNLCFLILNSPFESIPIDLPKHNPLILCVLMDHNLSHDKFAPRNRNDFYASSRAVFFS